MHSRRKTGLQFSSGGGKWGRQSTLQHILHHQQQCLQEAILQWGWISRNYHCNLFLSKPRSKYTGNIWYIRPIETPLDVIPHTIWNTMYCWNHMGYRTALHCYFLTEKHWAQVKFSFTRGQVELRDIKMWCLKQVQKSFLEVWKVTRWVFKCLVGIATSRLTLTKPLLSTLERFSGKQNVLAIIFCILFPPHLNFPFLKEWKRNTFSYISFLILCNAISHCTA